MWCGLCDFLIIKLQIALHYVMWYGAVRLYYFVSSFDVVFAICAVYAVW